MKNSATSQRLRQIMNERNIRQVDILSAAAPFCAKYNIRLNRNDLSQYVSGKVEPGQEKLTILSLALDVPEAWLMGYEIPLEKREIPASMELDGLEQMLVGLFRRIPEDTKLLLLSQLKGIIADQGEKASHPQAKV